MLDPKILRDKPEIIQKMLKDREVEFDLETLIKVNNRRLELIVKVDNLRQKKNKIILEIVKKKKSGDNDISTILSEQKEISKQLLELEPVQSRIEQEYLKISSMIPNLIHESVPIGPPETANKELRRYGRIPNFNFKSQNHIDISTKRDLVDLERAAKVAGARFYYLKNDLLMLNQALINYSLDFLSKKNYNLVQPPYMINGESMKGAIITEDFEDVIYKIENQDLYLIGTSEHALAAMHSKEILDGKELPLRYAGTSTCFRKEAGAHGRDQKGIFRVHQFEKIEQFVFSRPEESWNEQEKMIAIAEEFYQNLEIPYRVVLLSSVDMSKVSAKTYDIEAWMAGQNAYREIVSCSNCLDYQARRLKIRFRDKSNEETRYIHTLNSTLAATSRILVSIIENFQTKDKHIEIPKVLQKYIGKKII